jgi:hypothetical protein
MDLGQLISPWSFLSGRFQPSSHTGLNVVPRSPSGMHAIIHNSCAASETENLLALTGAWRNLASLGRDAGNI